MRGKKLVNGKEALKNNSSSFSQSRISRSKFNQRFSYVHLFTIIICFLENKLRECNRNTFVYNDRFYSNGTESKLILTNQRERGRGGGGKGTMRSFNFEHEFANSVILIANIPRVNALGNIWETSNHEATIIISID